MNFARTTLFLMLSFSTLASAQTRPATLPSKLWATDFRTYIRSHRGNWMVANSVRPALTAEEAIADARREAARGLANQILPRMTERTSIVWLQQRLEASVMTDDWIEDQVVTVNERPYGTIWSASLLINTAPKSYNRILAALQLDQARERSRIARMVGSCLILMLAVACGFLITNSLTRGFLRFRLVLISVIVIAGGVFGITHLI
jgi:hypothetical protein